MSKQTEVNNMIELKVKCQEHGEIMRAYVENATIWIDPKSCSYCYDKAKEGQPPEEVPPQPNAAS